jgi:tetratricopeptide (TPR) repeat protein
MFLRQGNGDADQRLLHLLYRRTVRQQLNRAAPTPPVAAEAQVLEAQVSQGNAGAVQSSEAAADWALQLQAALKQAQTLVAVGRYSEALDASEACINQSINALPLLLSPPQRGPAVQLHALRGHSHGQLGGVKQAVIEYSAAIKLAQEGGEWSDEQQQESVDGNGLPSLCQLLLARSAQYEQQERLEDALKDVLQAIKLQQQPVPSLLLAAQRLRAQQAVSTPRL